MERKKKRSKGMSTEKLQVIHDEGMYFVAYVSGDILGVFVKNDDGTASSVLTVSPEFDQDICVMQDAIHTLHKFMLSQLLQIVKKDIPSVN